VSAAGPWARLLRIEPGEARPLAAAGACFLALMASYAILKPLRDALALLGNERTLPWLFLVTLGAMAAVQPIFAAVVARTPRRTFVPAVSHASAALMVAFCALLRGAAEGPLRVAVARAFFVWVSVFNLFALSVFWGLVADVFRPDQAARLFGIVAVGGTLGAVVGSLAAAMLAPRIGPLSLLLVSAALLEIAVVAARALLAACPDRAPDPARAAPPSPWVGAARVVGSPYLRGIAGYLALFTVTSTLIYFEQAHIVGGALRDTAQRTALFARVDLAVNVLTVVGQGLVTARVLGAIGVAPALVVLPALTFAGFVGLGAAPSLRVLIAFQIARRATDYVLAKPAREVLFTVLRRDDKYQAKSLIDTFVYRGGDAIGAWVSGALLARGSAPAAAVIALPICVAWGVVAIYVGRQHGQLAAAGEGSEAAGQRA
jgi:AAA family ATP:ADP antiporter